MRNSTIPTSLILLLSGSMVWAEAPSPLELVRGLRSQGMPDLAEEFLKTEATQKYLADHPEEKAIEPLELARIRAEMAHQESDEDRKLSLLLESKAEFENFLRNPKAAQSPLRPLAALELARLVAAEGREIYARSRRLGGDEKAATLNQARTKFRDADNRLEVANTEIEKSYAALGSPTSRFGQFAKAELNSARFQSRLEAGKIEIDLAITYRGPDSTVAEIKQRELALKKAHTSFEKLVNNAETPRDIYYTAKAWLAYSEDIDQKPLAEVKKKYEEILKDTSTVAEQGRRWAGYFYMRQIAERGGVDRRFAEVDRLADAWVTANRSALKTSEGQAVLFLQGKALMELVKETKGINFDPKTKMVSISPAADDILRKAERVFRQLVDMEGEFADRASIERDQIILIRSRSKAKANINNLMSFEECYLNAQVELAELDAFIREKKEATADEIAKECAMRYRNAIESLTRGLNLVTPKDPPREVFQARLRLANIYLTLKDDYRTAVMGHAIAEAYPRNSRAVLAAIWALQSYGNVVRKGQERNSSDVGADRERMVELARFVIATWPKEPLTDLARHQLGFLLRSNVPSDPVEAVETLVDACKVFHDISPGYNSLARARFDQSLAAFELSKLKFEEDTDQKIINQRNRWIDVTVDDLERLSYPDPSDALDVAQFLALCKLQLGTLKLRLAKDVVEIEEIGKTLTETLVNQENLKSKQDIQSDLIAQAQALIYRSRQKRAADALDSERFTEGYNLIEPLIEQVKARVKQPVEGGSAAQLALQQLQRSTVTQGLLLSVREGKIERANELFELLQAMSAGKDDAASALPGLVQQMRATYASTPEKQKKNLAESFNRFLDRRAADPKLKTEVRYILAQAYSSLENYKGAAKVLEGLPQPTPQPAAGTDEEPAVAQERRLLQQVQLTRLQALRKSGAFKDAEKLLEQIEGTPKSKGWGANNLDVRKERLFLLEDKGELKKAVEEWRKLQASYKLPPLPSPPSANEIAKADMDEPGAGQRLTTEYTKKAGTFMRTREFLSELRFYDDRIVYKSYLNIKDSDRKKQRLEEWGERLAQSEQRERDRIKRIEADIIEAEKKIREAERKNDDAAFKQASRFADVKREELKLTPFMGGASIEAMYRELLLSCDPIARRSYEKAGGSLTKKQ